VPEVRERQDGAGVERVCGRGFERFDRRGGCDGLRRRVLPVRKERRQLRALVSGRGGEPGEQGGPGGPCGRAGPVGLDEAAGGGWVPGGCQAVVARDGQGEGEGPCREAKADAEPCQG
jgi:hypothetical protein